MDPAGRINRFRNRAIVVAGDNDRIAICVDAADDANMAAATASHYNDGADLGSRHTGAVACIGAGKIRAARVTRAATSAFARPAHHRHRVAQATPVASQMMGKIVARPVLFPVIKSGS